MSSNRPHWERGGGNVGGNGKKNKIGEEKKRKKLLKSPLAAATAATGGWGASAYSEAPKGPQFKQVGHALANMCYLIFFSQKLCVTVLQHKSVLLKRPQKSSVQFIFFLIFFLFV